MQWQAHENNTHACTVLPSWKNMRDCWLSVYKAIIVKPQYWIVFHELRCQWLIFAAFYQQELFPEWWLQTACLAPCPSTVTCVLSSPFPNDRVPLQLSCALWHSLTSFMYLSLHIIMPLTLVMVSEVHPPYHSECKVIVQFVQGAPFGPKS